MAIEVVATTRPDTRIYIPLGGNEEVGKEEYIRFISFSEAIKIEEAAKEAEELTASGMDFKLDLTLTRDAYAELIF